MESIQLMRERKGLTQQQVAKQLGTHQPVISQIEQGEVELSEKVATNLAALYSVPATRVLAAHKNMQAVSQAVSEVAAVKSDATETLRLAGHLARIERDPNVPEALRKRARKARGKLNVEDALVAVRQDNLDPEITATGFQVAHDGQGNYYVVDTTTDPPTITPVQFGDLVQQQGQPLGSKTASKSTSRRDAWGRGRRNE